MFSSEIEPQHNWRSYATSALIHIGVLILLLIIPLAVSRKARETAKSVATTLIAPQLKPYKPPVRPRTPKLLARNVIKPKPLPKITPPVKAPEKAAPAPAKPQPVPQPQIAMSVPAAPHEPAPMPAPALKPQIHTGLLDSPEAAKKAAVSNSRDVKVGGFGDPNGAKASPDAKQPSLVAKVGSFDNPAGEGTAGGRSNQGRGVVQSSGFGSAEASGSGAGGKGRGVVQTGGFGSGETGGGSSGTGRGGTVKTGGFNEAIAEAPQTAKPKVAAPVTTPVEILSKPRPVYTAEARSLRLEGEVSLEVIFSAQGRVRVIRVIRGLGHGLDEAAQAAAVQIHFKPGTRDGEAVDTKATVRIQFQLT